jgi:hypothetical protein
MAMPRDDVVSAPGRSEMCVRSLVARPVTVDGVGDEYTDAYDAEEHGDSFQHNNAPKRAGGQI